MFLAILYCLTDPMQFEFINEETQYVCQRMYCPMLAGPHTNPTQIPIKTRVFEYVRRWGMVLEYRERVDM